MRTPLYTDCLETLITRVCFFAGPDLDYQKEDKLDDKDKAHSRDHEKYTFLNGSGIFYEIK